MNSAYAVGATFTLENLFSPELNKIAGDLTKFDARVEKTKLTFVERLEKMAGSFNLLGPAADKAALAVVGAMGKAEAGVMKAATGINGELDAAFSDADIVANKAANGMIAAMKRAELASRGSADAIQLGFSGAFTGIDTGVVTAADTITKQFSRITRAANKSVGAIAAMRSELAALSSMHGMPMPQLPGSGGRGGGRGGHRGGLGHSSGGFHFDNRERVNTPFGHVSGRGGAGALLASIGVVGDAVYEASEVEDIVTRALMTSGITPGKHPLTDSADGRKLFAIIQNGAKRTGFSQHDVGDMILGTEREFQGLAFNQKMDTLAMLLPAMGAEAHLRHTDLKGAGENIVSLMHGAGTFKPEDMPEIARAFQFTTMATPVDLSQFKNALSYSLPTLHGALGMDPSTIMLLTSMMQTAGVTNTKSGTWLRSFFVDAEPSTDVLGHLTKTQQQHNKTLYMLGLADDAGHQNWKVNGADGNIDWNASVIAMAGKLKAGIDSIPEGQRADVLHRAFGTQGSGMATLLEQQTFREQLPVLADKMKMYKGGDWTLGEYSESSTIQQSRIAAQEFQTLMADLGTRLLPPINFALHGMTDALEKLPDDWEKTKKLWSDRFAWLQHPFGGSNGPDLGPMPTPKDGQGYLMGPGFQLNAYHEGSIGGISDAEETIYRGTLRAFTDFAAGKSVSGGIGGGSGFVNASFEGGSFGGGGAGGGAANLRYGPGGHSRAADLSGGAATGEHADYIRAIAAKYGIDPRVAVAVANSEGLHTFVGDRGSSFGDFQLHYGNMAGGGMATGGLGDDFTRETGLDARNPANWKAADEWALKRAAKGGWGPWHGAARIGVHGMAGIGGRPTGAFTSGGDGNFPGLTGNDPVGLALGMLGFGEGQSAAALGHHMSPGEWCADFVNGVIEKSGGRGTGSAMARSFSQWGQHVDIGDVKRGDVIEERHGDHIGHVGFATGEVQRDANGNITHIGMVSGNYGHAVKRNWERVDQVGDLRRGASSVRAAPKQPIHVHVDTALNVDGKKMAGVVSYHQAKRMRYPTNHGIDGHGHFVPPTTTLTDSA